MDKNQSSKVESLAYILCLNGMYYWHWIFGEGYPHKIHALTCLGYEQYHQIRVWFSEEIEDFTDDLNGYSIHIKISKEDGEITLRDCSGKIKKTIKRTLGSDTDSGTFRAMWHIAKNILGANYPNDKEKS